MMRAYVRLLCMCVRVFACVRACVTDERETRTPFSTNWWNQEHELINRYKVAQRQKWQKGRKKCPVTFRSLRKLKRLKLPPVFSASLANVKQKKEIHKEKRRWYLPDVAPCGFPSHTHKRFVRAESLTR